MLILVTSLIQVGLVVGHNENFGEFLKLFLKKSNFSMNLLESLETTSEM